MCASFEIKKSLTEIASYFDVQLEEEFPRNDRIYPFSIAPVVVMEAGSRLVRPMSFSLIPSWSSEPRTKFATHNARVESIDSKATWKTPLSIHRCLVPITNFFEPIYSGKFSGHMVGFHLKGYDLLSAVGIWNEWVDKKTGEIVPSFTIITCEPNAFVKSIGHDRSPLFVNEEFWDTWVSDKKEDPSKIKKLLQKNVINEKLILEVTQDRALKKKTKA